MLAVLKFSRAGIQDAGSRRQSSEGLLQPSLAIQFVDVFAEHGDPVY